MILLSAGNTLQSTFCYCIECRVIYCAIWIKGKEWLLWEAVLPGSIW